MIREISPVVDAGGTIAVVAEVTEGAALPAPGEGVEVQVELDRREQTLTVPEEALLVSEGGAAVFVAEGSTARRKAVTTGGRAGDGSRCSPASRQATRWWWMARPSSPTACG